MMNIYQLKHLPIVDQDEIVIGVVSEDDLIQYGLDNIIGGIEAFKENLTVKENDHLFDVLALVAQNNLSSVPVVDDENKFVGIISQHDLLQYYADNFSYKEHGSIVVIQLKDSAYSLAEISRLVEGENCLILSSSLSKIQDTDYSLVTIKLNRSDISAVIATLERFDYHIKASFTDGDYNENLKERYDALMNYLNV
jgi:predicted transcriptional regulator